MQKPNLAHEMELEDKYVMHTYGRKPVEFVEGHGMTLVDTEGKEYLDFLGGIAVVGLGHSHPAVVAAIQEQAAKLMQTSNYYYADGRGELAQKISRLIAGYAAGAGAGESAYAGAPETAPDERIFKTFFANTGAEANEGAFKLARRYSDMRGRKDAKTVLYLGKSFHGRTIATIAATGQPSKQDIFKPLPEGFRKIEQNDMQSFFDALEAEQGQACAVVVECIQGESGIHPCSTEYLQALREETAKRDILLIVDEVQTGFFRCGTHPFAFQHYGIQPDVVTMAKGIASGFPMGAFAARAEVADAMQPGDHGSTFGGNPLAVAAALATINTMLELDVASNSHRIGNYLAEKLAALDGVSEVRGLGLMRGAQLDSPIAPQVVERGLESGLVLNAPCPDVLRFVPPLICTKDDVDVLICKLSNILKQMRQGGAR